MSHRSKLAGTVVLLLLATAAPAWAIGVREVWVIGCTSPVHLAVVRAILAEPRRPLPSGYDLAGRLEREGCYMPAAGSGWRAISGVPSPGFVRLELVNGGEDGRWYPPLYFHLDDLTW